MTRHDDRRCSLCRTSTTVPEFAWLGPGFDHRLLEPITMTEAELDAYHDRLYELLNTGATEVSFADGVVGIDYRGRGA